jgi:ubiquinone/menaquinone biosynthesis C-methylase UbiE
MCMPTRRPLEHGVLEGIEMAKRYDQETRGWMRYVSKSFISMVKAWETTSGKVLDVGTGTGRLAIELARGLPGLQVVGLDLSDAALGLARDHVEKDEVPLAVSFEKGDAQDMPFGDGTFDLVISSNTLHLVNNPVKMFDEIDRVLKPDGRFLLSDLRRSWLGVLTEHIRAAYSPREIEDLLSQSHLQNWKVKDSFFWLSILKERSR